MRTMAIVLLTALATTARAEVQKVLVKYKAGEQECVGYLAYDDAAKEKKPGVLVFHEWWGLNDYAAKRAVMLAEQGYVAFCADLYGDGQKTDHPSDAMKFATALKENEKVWLERATAAMKTLQEQKQCDSTKIATIGYCLGGTTALNLAFSGADVKAVVTFHAGLPVLTPEQAKKATARILICHGAADPFIPEDAVKKFRTTLDDAKTKYEFTSYPGVVHSFTVEGIEKKGIDGLKYDTDADKKSWAAMMSLFKDSLK